MLKFLFVGVGGFIGSALRYEVGGWIVRVKGATLFPWETLAINVAGCLLIGALAALSETRGVFGGTTRVFLFVGVLGGFTTFSTFGYETFQLLRDGQHTAALASALLQVCCGLGAVWAGDALVRAVWG